MRLIDFEWIADENIHPNWIEYCGKLTKIYKLSDVGLLGTSDIRIFRFAYEKRLIVFTQDRDFGQLALLDKEPFWGIIYLRPGHLNPQFHI